ncbi:MAG: hypothetical protein HQK91_01220 [Nitrospirae bacterium]|nr:hypothetical protein [Nitrospirota bacterium]
MSKILIERGNILSESFFMTDDKELCNFSFSSIIGNIAVVLVLSVAGCLCIGLPWYMFTVAGPVKAIAGAAIAVFIWVISGAILRGIFNTQ